MLAKKFRLPIKKNSLDQPKTLRGKYFLVKTAKSNLSFSRFGVITSSKTEKTAVGRNKIKRIIFNFIREKNLQLIPGFDFLFIAGNGIAKADKKEIKKDLEKILV